MEGHDRKKSGGSGYKSRLFEKMIYLPSLVPGISVVYDGKIDSWDIPGIVATGVFVGFGYAVKKVSDHLSREPESDTVKTARAHRPEAVISAAAEKPEKKKNVFTETAGALDGWGEKLQDIDKVLKKVVMDQKRTTMKLKEIDQSLKKSLRLMRGGRKSVTGMDSPEEWIKYDYCGLPLVGHPFGDYLPESMN